MRTFISILLFANMLSAHEAGESTAQIGPGKAVEAVDESKGLKLGEKAKQALKIKTQKLTGSVAGIPPSAILTIADKRAVYVVRDGWFSLVMLDGAAKGQNLPDGLKLGDEIVVHGSPLIRIAHLNVVDDDHTEHEEHEGGESHDEHDEKEEGHK